MGFIGGSLGYHLLKCISAGDGDVLPEDPYDSPTEKLKTHFGQDVFERTKGKTILDFGSGLGRETAEFAANGAKSVLGLEIQERFHEKSREYARSRGVSDKCEFASETDRTADIVVSLDSFEHFDDPAHILSLMNSLVSDDGEVWISFGWCWYHPHGGHLFSVFPWAHLVFTEPALIRWRSDFKSDGATKFSEVAGGLNQMTINRFEQLVNDSPLKMVDMKTKPIGPLRMLHCRLTREFTTSLIFARLKKRQPSHPTSASSHQEPATV